MNSVSINKPTPELPVTTVEEAQQYYHDHLGFDIAWLDPSGDIGAVSQGDTALFLRRHAEPIHPIAMWVYCEELEAFYEYFQTRGAKLIEPIETKPWGISQFTLADLHGNRFYFHHD